ncbi:MAG: amidohydrolase family protein [Ancalomicrobiaceae bacterium]|nr:amidohydrolase family protein [Ancalomicrobiaceae bacterium]
MQSLIFENARLLDGSVDEGEPDRFVRVAGNVIEEVSDRPIKDSNAYRIDLRGKTLMPGLIDCHVHINSGPGDPDQNMHLPSELVAYHAARILKGMLERGFTTVRDVGGATVGQVHAIEQGLIEGPRLVICGRSFVQTGGHTDYRSRYSMGDGSDQLTHLASVSRVVDGVDECRRAARDEIRKGAKFIKVMAGGGAASLHFPRPYLAYSMDELRAIQEEAMNAKTYVCVHTHSDEAVRRALDCGIRSIEHGTEITPETAAQASAQGAFVTPTIIAYEAQIKEAANLRLDPGYVERLKGVRELGVRSLETMRAAGVKLAYGSDVLGTMHPYQADEFMIRNEVLPNIDVIRMATLNAAQLIRMEGKVGTIAPGAFADLIVVDKDPLADISVLAGQGRHMSAIIKDGKFVKNNLDS